MSEAHPIVSRATYVTIFVVLICLTALTAGVANIDLGWLNTPIAVAIAATKASLVVLFFMHLRWDKPVNAIIAMAGFLFLGIFLMFCLIDFDARNNYLPSNLHPIADMPLAPGTAPAGEVLRTNAAAAEGGEKK